MDRHRVLSGTRALFLPMRVAPRRALLEACLPAALLLGLALLINPRYRASTESSALSALGWIWLVLWPAWRLRKLKAGHWWTRFLRGMGRALLCGVALGLSAVVLGTWLWPPSTTISSAQPHAWAGMVFGITMLFLALRLVITVAVALVRRSRRRLRWQLTASHLAVITLTFMAMSGLGSTIALNVGVGLIRPDAPGYATSVAHLLSYTASSTSLDKGRLTHALQDLNSGALDARGGGLLEAFSSRASMPHQIVVMSPAGNILGATADESFTRSYRVSSWRLPAETALLRRLRLGALAGHALIVPLKLNMSIDTTHEVSTATLLSAAPIMGPAGRAVGVVAVQVLDITLSNDQFLSDLLGFFGVSTLLILLATAVPVLGLSSLFGYLLARGLTRRLEQVSRVTRAVAAGDLTQRAPVTAQNEVRRLADDVNSMADHLQRTMGELRQARLQAENALRARQELVASISHELRTPLAIVQAHLEALGMHQPSAVTTGRLAIHEEITMPPTTLHALQNETQRLASLVEDLFALSRAQTGSLQVQCVPTDVAALVGDVAALMRPLAQRDGLITLSVEAWPGLPLALADPQRLRQILENLVRNAVRHTPDGGIIVLSVSVEGAWSVIAVADTGEGIPPDHLAHIFERFYKVDQARTRTSSGAGLGLAIVREFVELMGGRVDVESTPGEGSCFRVYLPLVPSSYGQQPATESLVNTK